MSGGLRLHLALAAAGVLGGLPVAAVTQWLRPDPASLWYDDSYGGWAEHGVAFHERGSRSTLVRLRSRCWSGFDLDLKPRCLNSVATRFGETPRWSWPGGGNWVLWGGEASDEEGGSWAQCAGEWRRGDIFRNGF